MDQAEAKKWQKTLNLLEVRQKNRRQRIYITAYVLKRIKQGKAEKQIMKVLLVSRGVFPVPIEYGAGAEAHMYNLANAIATFGYEVHYVTNVSPRGWFHENIVLHAIKSSKILANKTFLAWTFCHASGNLRALKGALKALKSENYSFDVIHSHGNLASLLLSYAKKNIPLVYTVHDNPPYSCQYSSLQETFIRHTAANFIDSKTWRHADHIIAVSKALKDEIMERKVPNDKISVISNGIGDEFLKESNVKKSSAILQEKYGITGHHCLYVGRLIPRKGLDYLLYALKKVSDVQCAIVGDGPQREHLLSLTRTLELQDRVVFTGYVPKEDLKHFYAAADFFVLPSLAEGLPLVVLEALATGTPIIASKVAGIPDIIQEGYNGLIVPPKDVELLAVAIQKLAYTPDIQKKMGAHARQTVNQEFSWKSIAKEVLRVYEKVCV